MFQQLIFKPTYKIKKILNYVFSLIICFSLQTYFLPIIGLVEAEDLTPGDLVVSIRPCLVGHGLPVENRYTGIRRNMNKTNQSLRISGSEQGFLSHS